MRRVEIPREMADTIYAKRVEESNALSAILIKLPDGLKEDEMYKYYSSAISKTLIAGLEDRLYTEKMIEELGLTGFQGMEGYYAFVEE